MNTTELLQNAIYPALYERVETALPEFGFKKKGPDGAKGFESTNTLKIDGTFGDASNKVRIYPDKMGRLFDLRGGNISIWDYLQSRDNLTDRDTLLLLAELAEIKLPTRELSEEELNRARDYRRRAEIWEAANDYLLDCLSNRDNDIATSAAAKEVREYLIRPRREGGRGYQLSDIRTFNTNYDREAAHIEAGFMPVPTEVYKHLQSKGFEEMEVRRALQLTEDGRIGANGYFLTLPYRDNSGAIRGLIIRNTRYNETNKGKAPKYLFSKSLENIKGKLLFNLRPLTGNKDLIIVESQFDAQLATVRGLANVVAIGGKSLTAEQAKQALRMKPNSVTVLLDNEKQTIPQVRVAIETLLNEDETLPVYVAQLPGNNIKDLEEYLTLHPVEQFNSEVFKKRVIYWKYLLNDVIDTYLPLEPTDEGDEAFLREVIKQANKITLPLHKDQYFEEFVNKTEGAREDFSITKETLAATADRIKYNQDKEEQEREFKRLLATAQDMQRKGETAQALQLLSDRTKEIKRIDQTASFAELQMPTTEAQLKERLQNKPDSLKSGYTIQREPLLIPAGAVSILAAPTSHGKTTFLINLGLNMLADKSNNLKKLHLFSYEEDADSVLINTLNAFIGENLSQNNRRTIKSYFTENTTEYFTVGKDAVFTEGKKRFFSELIDTQRFNIHYTNYDSNTLVDAIYYLHRQGETGAILIDYMQLLHKGERGNNKYGSRQEELKQICLDLKDAAVQTGLPIILGAQFNREVTNPLLLHPTKIGEAGDIERVANLIVGFWNNNFEPLNPSDKERKEIEGKGINRPDTLYTQILKNRGGRVGLADWLSYNGNASKIKSAESVRQNVAAF